MTACPDCGAEMQPGGVALACGGKAGSVRIQLPPFCTSRRCRSEKDAAAVARAVAAGVIDP